MLINTIIILLLISTSIESKCIDYDYANEILGEIKIGMHDEQVYKIMNKYKWKQLETGDRPLNLSNYRKKVNDQGDTFLEYKAIGVVETSFKADNNFNDIISININFDINNKKVVNTYLSKIEITDEEYKEIYDKYPNLIDPIWHVVKNKLNGKISNSINAIDIMNIQNDTTKKSISLDSILIKIHKGMSNDEMVYTMLNNGWIPKRNCKYGKTIQIAIDTCGDSIPIIIPITHCYYYSKNKDSKQIHVVIKKMKNIMWVDNIIVEEKNDKKIHYSKKR